MKTFNRSAMALLVIALALISCTAPKARLFGATGVPPVLNPNWSVTGWAIDEANVTTCASDKNNCTSATCGAAGSGVGPCATWHQVNDIRWGCLGSPKGCPRLRTNTFTITDLSADTNNTDPRFVFPTLENGASLVFVSTLPTPVLSNKNFTSVPSQWQTTCGSPNARDTVNNGWAIGQFVVDQTIGSSFWCNEVSVSTQCRFTIPMTNVTAPPSMLQTPGLWTTATGGAGGAVGLGSTDQYSAYTRLNSINFASIDPIIVDTTGTPPTNGVFIYHENVFDPGGVGKDPVFVGPGVTLYESSLDRVLYLGSSSSFFDDGCVNCYIHGGVQGGRLSTGHYFHILGGEVSSAATICNTTGNGIAIDGYTELFSNCQFMQGVSLGLVANGPGSSATLTTAGYSTLAALSPGYASVSNGATLCMSTGTFNVQDGTFAYDASHGGSAGVITSSGTLQIAGATTAESHSGTSPVVLTGGLTISTTNLDGAAGITAFGGTAYGRGGVIRSL